MKTMRLVVAGGHGGGIVAAVAAAGNVQHAASPLHVIEKRRGRGRERSVHDEDVTSARESSCRKYESVEERRATEAARAEATAAATEVAILRQLKHHNIVNIVDTFVVPR